MKSSRTLLLLIFAWLLALLPVDALASIPRQTFITPPLPTASAVCADPAAADSALTLHLDGLRDGGVLVRQNPWTMFDPEGLWQKEVGTLAALTAQYAATAAPGAAGAVIGTVAVAAAPLAVVGMTVYVVANPPDNGPGVPNTTPGTFDCNSGRQVSASRGMERGLIMPQESQADRDAYSRFLTTGDRRELDDYLAERSKNGGSPSGETAKQTQETAKKEAENAHRRGIRRAKSAERSLVESGHPGTADGEGWTWAERKQIAETGQFPKDTQWHHVNDAKRNPGMADNPDNIVPSRGGFADHVKKYHPGGTQAGSSGPLLDRKAEEAKQRGGER